MTPETWARAKSIYTRAMEQPSTERQEFIDRACRTPDGVIDEALRHQLLRLIDALPDGQPALVDSPVLGGLVARFAGTLPHAVTSLAPGETLGGGRFRILEQVGSGGMGEVYAAEDLTLNERVALKTILPAIAGDESVIVRFRREVQLARQISHPNVCRVFDLMRLPRDNGDGEIDVLTMEFLEGESLSQLLRRSGPLPLPKAEAILEQMTAGLAAAHRAGVTHRDFKSSNVFLTNNRQGALRVVVTDFGLARGFSGDAGRQTTQQGASGWGMGTPAYMAPEQVEGGQIGPAADQFALGVVMYELLTGTLPFAGDSPIQVAVRRTKEAPRRPRDLNPHVNAHWDAAVLRCLQVNPRDRFSTVEEVLAAVRTGAGSRLPLLRRKSMRSGARLAAGAALLAAFALWAIGRFGYVEPLPPGAARWYEEGASAAANGSWYRARQAFEAALQAKPNFAEARARLAQALAELDHYDDARAEILRATDTPKRTREEERLVAATRGFILRDLPQACDLYAALAASASNAARLRAQLEVGRCQDQAGQTAAAQSTFNGILAADPTNPAALAALALVEDRQGRSAAALSLLDRAQATFERLQNQEAAAELDLRRAAILENANRLPEAGQAAARTAAAGRNFGNQHLAVRARLRQASIAIKLGDGLGGRQLAGSAVEEARAARLENTIASGWIDLGSAFFSQRQYEDAETLLKQGLDAAQRSGARHLVALAQVELGRVYGQLDGRTRDGYPLLDQADKFLTAARMERDLLRSRMARANLYFIDDEAKAAAAFREIIPAARRLGEIRYEAQATGNLARLSEFSGDYAAAVETYRLAVELSRQAGLTAAETSNSTRLAQNLGRLGRYGEAQSLLESILASPTLRDDGARLTALRALANIYGSQLQFAKADRAALEALAFAKARRQTTDLRALALSRCVFAAEAAWPTAEALCRPLIAQTSAAREMAQWSDAVTALALVELHRGAFTSAAHLAAEARRIAQQGKQERNAWYALLIEADALRRSASLPKFETAAAQARREIEDLTTKWGKPTADLYLARPGIARRWAVVAKK